MRQANSPRAQVIRSAQLLLLSVLALSNATAQSRPDLLAPILDQKLLAPEVLGFQLRQYLLGRVPQLAVPANAEEWNSEAERIRKHVLEDVVFHGWPPDWVNAPAKFEELGVIAASGYRMHKLRYEIIPGFQSTAILYEPEEVKGRIPAILNLGGHYYEEGKAVAPEQKRCINYARRGMFALSLEFINCGELHHPDNQHWSFPGHLDLVGMNTVGLFYLAMRKGLDYLNGLPNVDRERLGATGVSGGGWQTMVLASLDRRVKVAIPVAGYGTLVSKLDNVPHNTGEWEQVPTDFLDGQDYSHLTAMRAPRPTLLIFDAEDDCCWRAPLVKPDVFDEIKPFFRLFGREEALAWHENTDPGTHNYDLDNREQSYRFFSKHFNLPIIEHEIPVETELLSYEDLRVGVPKDNLTILALARKFAGEIRRAPIPSSPTLHSAWAASERDKLRAVVRYKPVLVKRAWGGRDMYDWDLVTTKSRGVETRAHRFELSNGLSATGVWVKAISSPANAPIRIILDDKGKKVTQAQVSYRVNRGEQVLALDLLFTGDVSPRRNESDQQTPYTYALLLSTTGDRPIGIEAAQLIAITRWLKETSGAGEVRLEAAGIRSQAAALIAGAIEPTLYSQLLVRDGMKSLSYLLDKPITNMDAPDLFCLDLYRYFDLDRLAVLAEPTKIGQKYLETGPK